MKGRRKGGNKKEKNKKERKKRKEKKRKEKKRKRRTDLVYYLRHGIAIIAALLTGVATGRSGRHIGRLGRHHPAGGPRPAGRGHAPGPSADTAHRGRPQRLQRVPARVHAHRPLRRHHLVLVHLVRV